MDFFECDQFAILAISAFEDLYRQSYEVEDRLCRYTVA